LATALPAAALPGWIGDNACARWLAAVDKVSSAAATPSKRNACRNEKRVRSEVAIMRASWLWLQKRVTRRLYRPLSIRKLSTCDLSLCDVLKSFSDQKLNVS
jgi:hypothetical protein